MKAFSALPNFHQPDLRRLAFLLPVLPLIGGAGLVFWRPVSNFFMLQSTRRRINQVPMGSSYEDVLTICNRLPFVTIHHRRMNELTVELRTKEQTQGNQDTGRFHEWHLRFDKEQRLASVRLETGGWVWHR